VSEINRSKDNTVLELSRIDEFSPMNEIPESTFKIVHEYYELGLLYSLDETQSTRVDEILKQAIDNNLLNFYISEIDHLLGHRLGLLEDIKRESYADQRAMLREYLGINPACKSISEDESREVPPLSSVLTQ
jgi:hypothetical protein